MDSSAPLGIRVWAALILTPLIVGFGGTVAFLHFMNPPEFQDDFALAAQASRLARPEILPSVQLPVSVAVAEIETPEDPLETASSSEDTAILATTTASSSAPTTIPSKPVTAASTASSAAPSSTAKADEPVTGFRLNVPYYKQQYTNSCEAASLRMALAYRGIFKNDMELIVLMGYKPRPRDLVNNIWDDPQEMYVGEVDVVDISKGYGVYGKPVARVARELGRRADFADDITPYALAAEVRRGNPVLMWGYTSLTGSPYTWNTPEGKTVTAFRGEHSRLVVGYEGEVENPTGFYVHDPFNGREYEYWTSQALFAQFHAVKNVTNQAVVVR
ncbi:MAG TPA: C39 family peptidase [Candidatus Paceibacterota bacterium]